VESSAWDKRSTCVQEAHKGEGSGSGGDEERPGDAHGQERNEIDKTGEMYNFCGEEIETANGRNQDAIAEASRGDEQTNYSGWGHKSTTRCEEERVTAVWPPTWQTVAKVRTKPLVFP